MKTLLHLAATLFLVGIYTGIAAGMAWLIGCSFVESAVFLLFGMRADRIIRRATVNRDRIANSVAWKLALAHDYFDSQRHA